MEISSERLAYWYFRLNGFLGLENFIVHEGLNTSDSATEIDLLGIRFMHRRELYEHSSHKWMKDDLELLNFCPKDKIFIVFAEVKEGSPRINPSWFNDSRSMLKLLHALGCISGRKKVIDKISRKIQKYGYCNIHRYHISFAVVGNSKNRDNVPFIKIPVISWSQVLDFIYNRFNRYRIVKTNLGEWKEELQGKELRNSVTNSGSLDDFKSKMRGDNVWLS
ncbi:MAG: hypothetical protein ACOCT9_02110 [archaeon]